jgi:hypothetical protein
LLELKSFKEILVMVDVIYEVIRKFVAEQGLGVSLVVVLFLGIYYFVKNGEFVFRYPRPKDASKDKRT